MSKTKKTNTPAKTDIPASPLGATDPIQPKTNGGIVVRDPQVLRPVELPLVITPPEGEDWKNDEQTQYAKTLNAYAYRNPTKWATRKDVEIARLIEIGKDPQKYYVYSGEATSNFKIGGKLPGNQI